MICTVKNGFGRESIEMFEKTYLHSVAITHLEALIIKDPVNGGYTFGRSQFLDNLTNFSGRFENLRTVSFQNVGLGTKNMESLSLFTSKLNQLETLDISGNNLQTSDLNFLLKNLSKRSQNN